MDTGTSRLALNSHLLLRDQISVKPLLIAGCNKVFWSMFINTIPGRSWRRLAFDIVRKLTSRSQQCWTAAIDDQHEDLSPNRVARCTQNIIDVGLQPETVQV